MTGIDRRRFLLGAGTTGVVAAVAGGVVFSARRDNAATGGAPGTLAAFFGSASAAVRNVGEQALADPATALTLDEVVDAFPTTGAAASVAAGSLDVEVTDPQAFATAMTTQAAAEAAGGDLVFVAGFPLSPTEVAVATATALTAR